MILALAALLIQPPIPQAPVATMDVAALIETVETKLSAPASSPKLDVVLPVSDAGADLPAKPVANSDLNAYAEVLGPVDANTSSSAIVAQPGAPAMVSLAELLQEGRRNRRIFMGLGIASHSAAAFDAWTTRRAISGGNAREMNPMLRPFAGNASLYVAIQVGPTIMDYVGKKMMYSKHRWMRRMWWLPQTASIASSLAFGARNLQVAGAN